MLPSLLECGSLELDSPLYASPIIRAVRLVVGSSLSQALPGRFVNYSLYLLFFLVYFYSKLSAAPAASTEQGKKIAGE